MYLNARAVKVRNLSIAIVNGIITLIILLIAPLGLAAVLINTALVTVASYFTATAADWVVRYLQPNKVRVDIESGHSAKTPKLRHRQTESDLSQFD